MGSHKTSIIKTIELCLEAIFLNDRSNCHQKSSSNRVYMIGKNDMGQYVVPCSGDFASLGINITSTTYQSCSVAL